MQIKFGNARFILERGKTALSAFSDGRFAPLAEIQIAGEDGVSDGRMYGSSEKNELRYVAHSISDREFIIIQRSERVETRSYFVRYENVLRSYTEVTNIACENITLEHVSAFCIGYFANRANAEKIFLYRFTNSHHAECQPRKISLFDAGLFMCTGKSKKRICGMNTGSQSTKEELPQAIVEDISSGICTMFQIESCNNWYWEIGESTDYFYLNAGGGNTYHNGWHKTLLAGESYRTVSVAVVRDYSVGGCIAQMTRYRRSITKVVAADKNLPTIFNEYMHLSWDSPDEYRTHRLIPEVAALGIDYYVIDCGWHNEEPGNIIYPYVGQWRESKTRFPHGIKYTIDCIHRYGMKAGLWLEPEIVGKLCDEMIAYYPRDVWLTRFGKPIIAGGRRFLDFRKTAVVNYLNSVIDVLLGEYGADYLKFDYNQDCGGYLDGEGDALEQNNAAFLSWVDGIYEKYPNVIIEACSSGGMRLDYGTLSHYSIVSSSDQTDYRKYPYIAANILAAVLPEQAAVWSYPAASDSDHISDETVIANMINTFLGRMHLASDISRLTDSQKQLVRNGIKYYNSLTEAKKKGVPCFPLGFTDFSQHITACGLQTEDKIYLAVWNTGEEKRVCVPFDGKVESVLLVYPSAKGAYAYTNNTLIAQFDGSCTALFFEITIRRVK